MHRLTEVLGPVPKTTDLCDACDAALACALAFQSYGLRRAFTGPIRTLRCHEDIGLMRDTVTQPGHGHVLVIDGGGSLSRALFGDVMAAAASRNGWAGLVIHGVIRDADEINGMDMGVKALGTVPKRGERTGAGGCRWRDHVAQGPDRCRHSGGRCGCSHGLVCQRYRRCLKDCQRLERPPGAIPWFITLTKPAYNNC